MDEPITEYVTRGDLIRWLGNKGFTASAVTKLIRAETIPTHRFAGHKWNHFRVSQVKQVLGLN